MNDKKFEYRDGTSLIYLTVIDSWKHAYTGETMRSVRIESTYKDEAESYTRIVNEKEFNEYLKRKVIKPIGYAIFKNGTKEEIVKLIHKNCNFTLFEFETTSGAYFRFNIVVDDFPPNIWDTIHPPHKQRPMFERQLPGNDVWAQGEIDHVEIYEEHWK